MYNTKFCYIRLIDLFQIVIFSLLYLLFKHITLKILFIVDHAYV